MSPNPAPFARIHRASRRGVTLIELLVALVGFLLIGGAILEIYDETQKAAQKMMRRQASIDFAVDFIDRSGELLRQAVHPANLDTTMDGVAFQGDRFSVPAYEVPAGNGLFLVSVRPREDGSDGRRYEVVRQAWGDAGDAAASTQTALGLVLTEGEPTIAFRYATHASPGQPVDYKDRLAPGEWPAVVEISVEVKPQGGEEEPILMKSAVIPGRLPAVRPAAARPSPTPTPVPAAPLATQSAEQVGGEAEGDPAEEALEPEETEAEAGAEGEAETEDGEAGDEEPEPAEAGAETGDGEEAGEPAQMEAAE